MTAGEQPWHPSRWPEIGADPSALVFGADRDGRTWEATMAESSQPYLPRIYRDLRADHPGIAEAYDRLGDACRHAGPLSEREQRLVKLGIAVGRSSEGGVRSHVRRGLEDGLTVEEILHAIAIAIPTIGLPATAAAYRWAQDVPAVRGTSPAEDDDR